jgi:hypothetical protein
MKKLTVIAAALLVLVPSLAFSDSISLRFGYYMPRALSNSYLSSHPDSLWTIELDQMSFPMKDFRGGIMGFSYEYFVSKNFSLAFTLDSFNRTRMGYYNDWVWFALDEGDFAFPYELYDGDDIVHSFSVTTTPLQLSVKFAPLGRKTKIIPFVGGGATLNLWRVRMYGDMVDFSDPWIYTDEVLGDIDIYPLESVNGRESGVAFGWHAFGGIEVPIGYRATFGLEARWHSSKAKFEEWFLGFDDFELGGLALTAGFSYWF